MSQFTSSFWDLYIGIITIVSIVACGVLLKMQSVRRVDAAKAQTTHTWDEDLTEYHNPLPLWWMWLFYITIVFSLAYLVLYPGLGSFQGVLGWTQVKEYEQETRGADQQYGPIYARFAGLELTEVAKNPEAMAIGQRLFLNHCAGCHASDAAGSRGFPNLTDSDWLWGGDPAAIKASIVDGRTGVMPPWAAVLGEEGTKDTVHYVLSLSGLGHERARADRGKALFATNCVACHGTDGRGNPQLGAPNLTDKIWLHGSGESVVADVIARGRTSQMPAHKDLLSAAKTHILAAYVMSLSRTSR